eukprot:COSAG06_NODE_33879_length_483_cov_0.549479_1_plen_94_part_10
MHRRVDTCTHHAAGGPAPPRASPTPDDPAAARGGKLRQPIIMLCQRAKLEGLLPEAEISFTSPIPGWDPYKMSDASHVASEPRSSAGGGRLSLR